MKNQTYKALDKLTPKLKKKIRDEYNYLSILPFDELNAVSTKEKTIELFERLLKFNRELYLKIIEESRLYALEILGERGKKFESKSMDDDDFLDYILSSYNSVTCYLYKKEANRKRLRLYEGILTSKEFLDRKKFEETLRRSANLWFTQSLQYGIDITDKTALKVWSLCGVKEVMWNTSKDEKVCSECKKMSGMIFNINNVPSKVHYNCRCCFTPV